MSLPRTIQSMGGPYSDGLLVDDPTTTQSSAFYNRHAEDSAQATRTTTKAWVQFVTQLSNGACVVLAGQSHMGTGAGARPAVARAGAGLYSITYPSSFQDGLSQTENIVFLDAGGSVMSTSTFGRVQCTVNGPVISVAVITNSAGTDTASDLGGGVTIRVEAR